MMLMAKLNLNQKSKNLSESFVDSPDAIYMWPLEATHPYTWLIGEFRPSSVSFELVPIDPNFCQRFSRAKDPFRNFRIFPNPFIFCIGKIAIENLFFDKNFDNTVSAKISQLKFLRDSLRDQRERSLQAFPTGK